LDILEVLAEAPRGHTLNELAKASKRTVSEIFRMVLTLQHAAISRATTTTATASP